MALSSKVSNKALIIALEFKYFSKIIVWKRNKPGLVIKHSVRSQDFGEDVLSNVGVHRRKRVVEQVELRLAVDRFGIITKNTPTKITTKLCEVGSCFENLSRTNSSGFVLDWQKKRNLFWRSYL